MDKLVTPLGAIDIKIDGKSIPYNAQEGCKNPVLFPDVLARYQIKVLYKPDGNNHIISCSFDPCCSYERGGEADEFSEGQGFWTKDRIKLSIGVEYQSWQETDDFSDYEVDFLETGMAYLIDEYTRTEQYVFGIAWIDDCGWKDPEDDENYRSTQAQEAADPSFKLIF